jgi:predicted anti-sigma-YlaC factor YlaD
MKSTRHLTSDELIDHVYGLEESAHVVAHVAECVECGERFDTMESRRRESASAEPVSREFLAAQRRVIYSRIEQPPARRLRWLPALAAAGALAAVALIHKPAPPVVHSEPNDAQLFTEVYSMEESTEPAAAAPIHELFQDDNQ